MRANKVTEKLNKTSELAQKLKTQEDKIKQLQSIIGSHRKQNKYIKRLLRENKELKAEDKGERK
ncbi:MAG: hypothetical protein RSD67_05585 [Oscillospiraceae bacterium]